MDKQAERKLVMIAGIVWLVVGVGAVVASAALDGLPGAYLLAPFAIGIALVAWSFKMAEDQQAAKESRPTTPDAEHQPA